MDSQSLKLENHLKDKRPSLKLENLETNGDSEREAFRKSLDRSGVTEALAKTVEALMLQSTFPQNPMLFVSKFLADRYAHTHTSLSPNQPSQLRIPPNHSLLVSNSGPFNNPSHPFNSSIVSYNAPSDKSASSAFNFDHANGNCDGGAFNASNHPFNSSSVTLNSPKDNSADILFNPVCSSNSANSNSDESAFNSASGPYNSSSDGSLNLVNSAYNSASVPYNSPNSSPLNLVKGTFHSARGVQNFSKSCRNSSDCRRNSFKVGQNLTSSAQNSSNFARNPSNGALNPSHGPTSSTVARNLSNGVQSPSHSGQVVSNNGAPDSTFGDVHNAWSRQSPPSPFKHLSHLRQPLVSSPLPSTVSPPPSTPPSLAPRSPSSSPFVHHRRNRLPLAKAPGSFRRVCLNLPSLPEENIEPETSQLEVSETTAADSASSQDSNDDDQCKDVANNNKNHEPALLANDIDATQNTETSIGYFNRPTGQPAPAVQNPPLHQNTAFSPSSGNVGFTGEPMTYPTVPSEVYQTGPNGLYPPGNIPNGSYQPAGPYHHQTGPYPFNGPCPNGPFQAASTSGPFPGGPFQTVSPSGPFPNGPYPVNNLGPTAQPFTVPMCGPYVSNVSPASQAWIPPPVSFNDPALKHSQPPVSSNPGHRENRHKKRKA